MPISHCPASGLNRGYFHHSFQGHTGFVYLLPVTFLLSTPAGASTVQVLHTPGTHHPQFHPCSPFFLFSDTLFLLPGVKLRLFLRAALPTLTASISLAGFPLSCTQGWWCSSSTSKKDKRKGLTYLHRWPASPPACHILHLKSICIALIKIFPAFTPPTQWTTKIRLWQCWTNGFQNSRDLTHQGKSNF